MSALPAAYARSHTATTWRIAPGRRAIVEALAAAGALLRDNELDDAQATRRTSLRKKSVQKVSASDALIARSSTSRRPSPLTPAAATQANGTPAAMARVIIASARVGWVAKLVSGGAGALYGDETA